MINHNNIRAFFVFFLMIMLGACGTGQSHQNNNLVNIDPSGGGVANGAKNASLMPLITLKFSHSVDPNSVNGNSIYLSNSGIGNTSSSSNSNHVKAKSTVNIPLTNITVNRDGTKVTGQPSQTLNKNTTYFVIVNGIKLSTGQTVNKTVVGHFTTGQQLFPTVELLSQQNNAGSITLSPKITIMFNEDVSGVNTNNIKLHVGSASGEVKQIDITKSGNNHTYLITSKFQLNTNTKYYLVFSSGIKGSNGAQLKNTVFNFTTKAKQFIYLNNKVAILKCVIDADGNASECGRAFVNSSGQESLGLIRYFKFSPDGEYVYMTLFDWGSGSPAGVKYCHVNTNTGDFENCQITANSLKNTQSQGLSLNPYKHIAYFMNYSLSKTNGESFVPVVKCDIKFDGSVGECSKALTVNLPNGGPPAFEPEGDMLFSNDGKFVYLQSELASFMSVVRCEINPEGNFINCSTVASPDPGFFFYQMAINGYNQMYIATNEPLPGESGFLFNVCDLGQGGTSYVCPNLTLNLPTMNNNIAGVSVNRDLAYLISNNYTNNKFDNPLLLSCKMAANSALSNCKNTGANINPIKESMFAVSRSEIN